MNVKELKESYCERQGVLFTIAEGLKSHLSNNLISSARIDQVSVRVKEIESFCKKARAKDKDGELKYSDPINQIQDRIGARVVVYFPEDVSSVSTLVEKYYRAIERQTVVPDTVKEFGYEGKHYIFFIPDEILPRLVSSNPPRFFELQIRTLFQHAWSQLEHGLGYKPSKPLAPEERRKTAFTAAQAWGADKIFQELLDDTKGKKSNGK